MLKLYYSPGACSMAPHVILNEIGIPVELVKVDLHAGDNKKPEFLKVNPRGAVPVLQKDDGTIIREGAAIIMHILDNHPSPLLPPSGKERTQAIEWLMFANATMHPAYGKTFFVMKAVTDKAAQEQAFNACLEQINKCWKEVDERLAKNPYICGKEMTAADILLTVLANWGGYFPKQPTLGANVKRLIKEISSRPSYQKALQAEKVEYKAAA